MKPVLSIISPLKIDSEADYIHKRVKESICHWELLLKQVDLDQNIEIIIVDHGSSSVLLDELKSCISNPVIKLVSMEKVYEPFSIGACRNFGASFSDAEYILFHDIDLFYTTEDIVEIKKIVSMGLDYNDYAVIPCFYLTEEATNDYFQVKENSRKLYVKKAWLRDDNEIIQMYAPSTSSLLIHRLYYMALGGVSREYSGHGYEDFELFNRVSRLRGKAYLPHAYHDHKYRYDSLEYKGYRNFFAINGNETLMLHNIFSIHAWHPTGVKKSYEAKNQFNKKLFEGHLKDFSDKYKMPAPLGELNSIRNTLVLIKSDSLSLGQLRGVLPYLGHLIYKAEDNFVSPSELDLFCEQNNIDTVLFLNPFGNRHRLQLYNGIKDKFATLVFDRGALPDSWFFDPNGFNANSSSYSPALWDKELTQSEIDVVNEYISNLISSEATLETNSSSRGKEFLVEKYQLEGKKVLFVPFQRPQDSVIKHFSNLECYSEFVSFVNVLAKQVKNIGWTIIAKKHPLETNITVSDNVILLDGLTHINDAINTADATLTVNSGVGLLSLILNKPTIHIGDAFYESLQTGKKIKIDDYNGVIRLLTDTENLSVDREKVHRFVHYLVTDFYSFGKTIYSEAKNAINNKSALYTEYSQINIPNRKITLEINKEVYPTNSPVYSKFTWYLKNKNKPSQRDMLPAAQALPKKDVFKKGRTNVTKKKIKKLFREPKIFFRDAFLKRLN